MAIGLDEMLQKIVARREERDAEIRDAFRDSDTLYAQIRRDACRVVAQIGGYVVPWEPKECDAWIKHRTLHDPAFLAKANAVAFLIRDYAKFAYETQNSPEA